MNKIFKVSLLFATSLAMISFQPVSAQGLMGRQEFVDYLSSSLSSGNGWVDGGQYMNDFDDALFNSAISGTTLSDAQIRDIIYSLEDGYPGWIDHATEMSLAEYAREYLAHYANPAGDSASNASTESLPYQDFIGNYQSTGAVQSISLQNVTMPYDNYLERSEESLVFFLSNKVTVSDSFKPDTSHQLTFNRDGIVDHQGTDGLGYASYQYQNYIGEQSNMIKLDTNLYFYYNDVQDSYDLVSIYETQSNSMDDITFNVNLTRFQKLSAESTSQPSSYQNVIELHQAFEAYNWITSPEALEAYGDFRYVVENAVFGNGSDGTKTSDLQAMIDRTDYTVSEQLKLDHRNNYIISYPYYRPNGTDPFMQVSYPIYDIYAMGATLIFYEVSPEMFKPIDNDFYQYNSVSQFVDLNPNIIAVSQFWGNPSDRYQLAIPTINPSTGAQEVSFVFYDNGQIFYHQSVPFSDYKDQPAKANYLNFVEYDDSRR